MSGRHPSRAGAAQGASGLFTITLIKPGPGRGILEHWAYDDRAHALDEIGWLAERVAPGTELVLRDPEGNDLFRVARTA
ncbi:hypothetical protein [Falsiroseomonas tokyonensis]|uniref:Glyoxalase-like domain-containing protein n=1 Tax=Falsiroseomonas tokyonensis TaxID=430521 RepID=A0ABV7BNB8_9PROT|nr:hypothetical protein [Falsiroseomonas tokyonensis]MBU8537093.1 hypothetical protein [Falsiroseomonas tokyonensis]